MAYPLVVAATALLIALSQLSAREFSVVAYNVENLFDLDGIAAYSDYTPAKYTPDHLRVKLENITRSLSKIDAPRGADVVIFNEIEIDQTPDSSVKNLRLWLESVKNTSFQDLLKKTPLPGDLEGLPAEAWLLKACEDAGLKGYHVATAGEKPGTYSSERSRSVQNVIFSRFPIVSTKIIPSSDARAILEAQLDIDGHPLTVFANHWKSGAGDHQSEAIRIRDANALRQRIDQILEKNPLADIIVAGDLNSHYNQSSRYPKMGKTAVNHVLGAQGSELSLLNGSRDLYNLWFELPAKNRGSDTYGNEWGTLMHLIVSPGLYDNSGLQYMDNSFQVHRVPGMNADVFGRPQRWSRGKKASGFSDHFPIVAKFRVANPKMHAKWMDLENPSAVEEASGEPVPVISSAELFKSAVNPANEPVDADFRNETYAGRIFLVDAPATMNAKGHISVEINGHAYDVFTHNEDLRKRLREEVGKTSRLHFYGQLGTYRGRWQFMLHGKEWLVSKPSSRIIDSIRKLLATSSS
jgi:hypothetical protein